jgi:hypothetical protein
MAGKKIFIEYDIDSSDLKIANGETLSLTQQLRLLKKELQRGDLKPEQFDILRKKIGDTEDQIAKTTVKSKDFFGVMSTLPGPVGAFGGSLLGVVDTLKVFSSFSFKDIKNSLGDVLDDVKEITSNFFGFKDANVEVADATKETSENVNGLKKTLTDTATEAGATAAALGGTNKAIADLEQSFIKGGKATDTFINAAKNLKDQGLDFVIEGIQNSAEGFKELDIVYKDLNGQTRVLTAEQLEAAAAGKTLTNTTNGLTVAQESNNVATKTSIINLGFLSRALQAVGVSATVAATAVAVLEAALLAVGIGVIIAAVVALGSALVAGAKYLLGYEESTKETEAAVKALNDALAEQERLLGVDIKALEAATKQQIARAKIAGKTEEEIFEIQKEGNRKKLQELRDYDEKLYKRLAEVKNNEIMTTEEKGKILEEINKKLLKSNTDIIAQINENEQARLDFEVSQADKRRAKQKEAADKAAADAKEQAQKRINDTKSAEAQLDELIRSNSELRIRDERERQFQELKNQKQVEEEKIKALSISEELRGKLLEQVRLKYGYKLLNMNQKFVEEDLKALKEFQRKREDIEIAAIEDTRKREDAEREVELKRNLEDLEEDKEFAKLSEEAKEEIRKNIRQRYANEAREDQKSRDKEDQDDRLKKLDDELRFLQIRQEAIRAGTKAFFDGQREILAVAEKREIELAEGKEKEITAIKEKYAKLRKDIDQQEKMATLSAIGETIGAIGNLTAAIAASYDEEAKTSKEAFEKRKKLQIATAVMSAASGIIQILTQPSTLPSPFDWIVKGINAAALAVTTAVQIKNIKNTKFEDQGGGTRQAGTVRGMANGGIVRGPGGPKSDSVPTNLSNGEAVMTSGAVTMFAPLLSMMNQMGGGASFSSDISVASADNPIRNNPSQEQTPVIMKTYVVESELTTSQQKQARLKELSTL